CRALNRMHSGYGCVLIQENAGAGQGGESAKEILKHNTLVASIRMPADLFRGKSSPQTAIYLFKVNQPHNPNDYVSFIDMSEDGYARGARRKSSQAVNLKDVDHAKARYQEVLDIVLGRKPRTNYYTEENGTVIKDIITLNGDDWTFNHHKKIDLTPSLDDFKKTVSDYLSWKVSLLVKNKANFQ
ncbi:MAG: N-6 DNA methylase, partial [Succinivibrio dextrinosolvens]|nr:N-6 DNA methylase [Succinivibrio dextrinosolvens]